MTKHKVVQLGVKARDIITGFEGVITSRVEYLTGCTQWGVTPPVGKDGKTPGTEYFDENRIVAIGGVVLKVKPKLPDGGPNRDAPNN